MAILSRLSTLYFGALLLAAVATAAPTVTNTDSSIVSGKYIVTLKESAAVNSHLDWVKTIHRQSTDKKNTAGVEHTFGINTWNAYSGEFDDSVMKQIKASPEVDVVEPVYEIHLQDLVEHERALKPTTQRNAPWGLATISHRAPGSEDYIYDASAGANTYVYVVDTGVRVSHSEFGGRASLGHNVLKGVHEDDVGHGTHVAGIIGGSTYGVAKKTKIISVKAFNHTYTSNTADAIAGFNWAYKDIKAKKRVGRSVINLSLGLSKAESTTAYSHNVWDRAISAAYSGNVIAVVAAGNGDEKHKPLPASVMAPASVSDALTVASLKLSNSNWYRASSSNYGPAVDIFAPGADIIAASHNSDTDTVRYSGTSMAAAHVSGLVAYIQGLKSFTAPGFLVQHIKKLGTSGRIKGELGGSPNLVAYNGVLGL